MLYSWNEVDSPLSIIITGDFCPVERIEKLCLNTEFGQIFGDVLPILKDKDLSITNLECPLTRDKSPINKKGPNLIADPKCVGALKYADFDIVSLANNHILDQGENGLRNTLETCKKSGVKTVGAGENLAGAIRPLFVTIKGQRVSILSFAEHEFSIATQNSAGAAPLNPIKNYYQILEAKRNSDVVIVIIHGGNEHYPLPSPRMVDTYRFFADLGVTAIIGHHTHCPSGFEIYNGVPIFYSLGNFIFDWKDPESMSWYEGYFVKLTIIENWVADIALTPYFQCKKDSGLQLMDKDESTEFLKQIEEYSNIIQDSDLLENKWFSFCKSKKSNYFAMLLSLNIFQRQLVKRGLFTVSFSKKRKLITLSNLIRCEAHRDAVVEIIRQELQDELHE